MILVTGANGFVGAAIARSLIDHDQEVCGLVRTTSDLRRLEKLDFSLRYADIEDLEALEKAVAGCDTIIHCAARSSDWGSRTAFRQVNVGGVKNVIEAAERSGTVRSIIHLSSANVAGYGSRDVTEEDTSRERLRFHYSRSKLEAEEVALRWCEAYNLQLTILRPSAIYGPGDWKWSYEMVHRIAHGGWPLVDSGKAVFTPLYINNLCQAVELTLEQDVTGGIYNITDDITVSWREFSEKLAIHLGARPRFRNIPYPVALPAGVLLEAIHRLPLFRGEPIATRYRVIRAAKDFHYSIEKAKKQLAYQPDTALDTHLHTTVEWYRSVSE
ncbi:NAD-dependent epimerase/dehydratase family protein [Candidatus Zixiibacteriota bacterium]